MDVHIKFLGAAQSVTGSKYLLTIDQKKVLVDCGLFQGKKELRLRNWDKLPVDPSSIDVVLITHAHIDHIGYLPRLVKDGFKGRIICTDATDDLMKIMLQDAAKLQEEEAVFAFKRGYSKHNRPEPLFTTEDALRVLSLTESHKLGKPISLFRSASVTFYNAGHILGSAFAEIRLKGNQQERKIVFSGDLGRYDDPVMYPPAAVPEADVLLIESTYGDRMNPIGHVEETLAQIVKEAVRLEGAIIIPAFAVGRTQSLVFYFHKLMASGLVPTLPIYIDSPMAISVTDLYERHSRLHKIKVTREGNRLISIFDSPHIYFCQTRESSKAINAVKKACIIISASGMATGGRVLHHLFHRLRKENDTVLFAGFQAEGSRGRIILEGGKSVKIFGEEVPINCRVRAIHGLSAHADQAELLKWLGNFKSSPKHIFITHGEPQTATAFAGTIEQKLGWKAIVPNYLETFELFTGI